MAGRSAASGELQSMIDDLAGQLGRSVVSAALSTPARSAP